MSTRRLTTAQALVTFLSNQYTIRDGRRHRLIPATLGIFGHGNVAGLGQALDEFQGDMPFVQGRNEQSLVHLAVGFAKAMRRRATFAVTASIGPGATNMVTGAALATVNRLPVLLLPGDTYATRRQGPVLQQLEHPAAGDVTVNDCFRPVARFFDRIQRPEQLLTALPEAMRVLTSPSETGAVVLALPQDIQSEAFDYPAAFFERRDWPILRPAPDVEHIAKVADLLAQARRPVLIAGGGVRYSDAEEELARLADRIGIPVVETFAGKGTADPTKWWALGGVGVEGNPAANAVARDADLVLHVGTRLTDFTTASQSLFGDPEVQFASINVTDHDARKQGAAAIVVADAKRALQALDDEAASRQLTVPDAWRQKAETARSAWNDVRTAALAEQADDAGDDRLLTQGQLIGILNRHTSENDTIVAAAGGPPGDLLKVWDTHDSAQCHLEFGYSCMGYELPATLGVRLAQPEGQVLALIGDGTFLMQPTELVTAVQEGLHVTIVISDNRGFQVIRRLQMLRAGRHYGNERRHRSGELTDAALDGNYLDLDLATVAAGLGATAITARTADEVVRALDKARQDPGPVVIVVPTQPHANLPGSGVWWDVAPAEVSSQAWVRERRAEYDQDRSAQRWHG